MEKSKMREFIVVSRHFRELNFEEAEVYPTKRGQEGGLYAELYLRGGTAKPIKVILGSLVEELGNTVSLSACAPNGKHSTILFNVGPGARLLVQVEGVVLENVTAIPRLGPRSETGVFASDFRPTNGEQMREILGNQVIESMKASVT